MKNFVCKFFAVSVITLVFMLGGTVVSAAGPAGKRMEIAVVVKIGGIPWFNAMEGGIKRAAQQLGVDAWMVGPSKADAISQIRLIDSLIKRRVDVIAVVPNDSEALEPALRRAREAGIKVITHESPDQRNNDWNVELISTQGFGAVNMDMLAKTIGQQGKYAVYVGGLSVTAHVNWAYAAIAYQKKMYPKMELVETLFPVGENAEDSYQTALKLMQKYPDLKGILAFGSQGPIGAARAVEEKGKIGSFAVVGTFSPGQGKKYVTNGAITGGYLWSPDLAGELIVRIAAMLAKGGEVQEGMDIQGVGKARVLARRDLSGKIAEGHGQRSIIVERPERIDRATIDKLVKMGM